MTSSTVCSMHVHVSESRADHRRLVVHRHEVEEAAARELAVRSALSTPFGLRLDVPKPTCGILLIGDMESAGAHE